MHITPSYGELFVAALVVCLFVAHHELTTCIGL